MYLTKLVVTGPSKKTWFSDAFGKHIALLRGGTISCSIDADAGKHRKPADKVDPLLMKRTSSGSNSSNVVSWQIGCNIDRASICLSIIQYPTA